MDENQTSVILPLKSAYSFGTEHGLQQEIGEIRDLEIEWDRSYTSSLRKGYIVDLFEKHGLFGEFKKTCWPNGNTPSGEKFRLRYLRIKQQYEDFLAGRGGPDDGDRITTEEESDDQEFAAESDLRDFLAKNLTRIEPDLSLYQSGDRSGVEFPIESGFIDILAVDGQGRFVVIELKLGRGRNKAVGQLSYYMGWVDAKLGKGPCRGMLIAKEIPDDLVIAVRRVPGVSLLRYHLAVSVEVITPESVAATPK